MKAARADQRDLDRATAKRHGIELPEPKSLETVARAIRASRGERADYATCRRGERADYAALKAEELLHPENSRKGPPIALGSAWDAPDKARARSDAAEAAMAQALAGRRFSIGEPGERRGAVPYRPETVVRTAAS